MSGLARKLMGVTKGGAAPEGWNISNAVFVQSFSVSAQEGSPIDLSFSPDGTNMYVLGASGADVNQYSLSTSWDVSTASFVRNRSVSAQSSSPRGLDFKPDGLRMYVCGNGEVNEYSLSTAWNISTTSFVRVRSLTSEGSGPVSVFFRDDGLKMYIGDQPSDTINEYNLSTAWNVSSASFVQGLNVVAQETRLTDVFFKPDGLKMYVIGNSGDDVNEYDLSTAWDVSTAIFLQNFSVSDSSPWGIFFKPDGLKMYSLGIGADTVREYDL